MLPAVLLACLCFVAVVTGFALVTETWGRTLFAVGVIGLFVLEARHRAGDG